MTIDTLNTIFLQVVKDMKYNPGLQIDTYRLNDSNPDLNHGAFGSTYDDYLDGTFWSRKFEQTFRGDINQFCGSYPVLMAEYRDATPDDLDECCFTVPFFFVVVDKIACEDCPPKITRNGQKTKTNALLMLRAFIKELKTYQYYEVDRDGTVTYEWLSTGRKAYEEDQGSILVYVDSLIADIGIEEIPLTEWGNFLDKRGWMARINFTICEEPNIEFDYETPVIEGLANTECGC